MVQVSKLLIAVVFAALLVPVFALTVDGQEPAKATEKDTGQQVVLKTPSGEIHGTIDMPKGAGPFPMVVFVQGSGPTDRDGNQQGLENDSLKLLGYGLVARGYATLRYDKRGAAGSKAAAKKDIVFNDFISDTVGWVDMLRKDERFSSVSVLGHSQGSLVVAATGNQTKVDAYISIAGAGVPIQETLKRQLGAKLFDGFKDKTFSIIEELAAGREVKEVPDFLQSLFGPQNQEFLISWMKFDPAKEVGALKVPVLIVQGTLDIQIAMEDAERLTESNENAELVVIKDMNHTLKKCPNRAQQAAAYNDPSLPVMPELIEKIDTFLTENLSSAESDGSK